MKPGGLVIEFGKGKPTKGDSEPDEMDDEHGEEKDFDDAAAQAFDALKNGDVEGFKLALKAAVMSCGDY